MGPRSVQAERVADETEGRAGAKLMCQDLADLDCIDVNVMICVDDDVHDK